MPTTTKKRTKRGLGTASGTFNSKPRSNQSTKAAFAILQRLTSIRSSLNAKTTLALQDLYPDLNIHEYCQNVRNTRRIDGGFAATLVLLGAVMRFVHPEGTTISELDLIPTAVQQKTGMSWRPEPQPLYQAPYLLSSFQRSMDPSFEKKIEDAIEVQTTAPSFRFSQLEGYPSDDEGAPSASDNSGPSSTASRKRRRQGTHFTHRKRRKIEEVKPDGLHLLNAPPHYVRFPLIAVATARSIREVLRSIVCHRVAHRILLPAIGLGVNEGSCAIHVAVSWASGQEKTNTVAQTSFKEHQTPFDMSSELDVAGLISFLKRSHFPSSSSSEPIFNYRGPSWRYDHKWHIVRTIESSVEDWGRRITPEVFLPLDTQAPEFLQPMEIDDLPRESVPWPISAQDLAMDFNPSKWYYRPAIVSWMAAHRAVPVPAPTTLIHPPSDNPSIVPLVMFQTIFRTQFGAVLPQLSAQEPWDMMKPILPPVNANSSPAIDHLLRDCWSEIMAISSAARTALNDFSGAPNKKPILASLWNHLLAYLQSQSRTSAIRVSHKSRINLPSESRNLSDFATNNDGNLQSEIRSLKITNLFAAKRSVAAVLEDWNQSYKIDGSEDWRKEIKFYFNLQENGPDPEFSYADCVFAVDYNIYDEELQARAAYASHSRVAPQNGALLENYRNWPMDITESGPLQIPFLLVQHQRHDNAARHEQRMHLTAVVTHLHTIHEIHSLPVFGLTTEGSVVSVVAAWWDESAGRVLIVDHGAPKFDIAKPGEAVAFMGVMAQLLISYAPHFIAKVNKNSDALRPPSPPGSDSPEPSINSDGEDD